VPDSIANTYNCNIITIASSALMLSLLGRLYDKL